MRVFDSFIFFNELDLLELRLNILNDVVDYFVLTESPFTVSGNEKPLYYQENKDRFGKFNDKIIHNITEEIPNDFSNYLVKKPFHTDYSTTDESGTRYIDLPIRFQRAVYNRECSAYGLLKAGANDEDIVMTSDADEIINPYVIEDFYWFDPAHNYVSLQRAFYFKLNYLYEENWKGTRLCTFKHLKTTTVDRLRTNWREAYQIEDAGWHFSFLGDADNVRLKLASYEHTENNISSNIDNMEQRIEQGLDPIGRSNRLHVVPIDNSYPEYILNNQGKYSQLIKTWN
jgi:beta-1,4-mannosyl-glycoprotein beta-1,4-N-acetylglucosaminyltransferase